MSLFSFRDYVLLYDDASFKNITGTAIGPAREFTSNGNQLFVQFLSDFLFTQRGFLAEYTINV